MARMNVPVRIRWSDIDAYGHVNNAAMLRLLEEARVDAFWAPDDDQTDGSGNAKQAPVIDGRPGSGTQTVIANQRIEYLLAVPYFRRPLQIQLWIDRIGGASLDVSYEIRSPEGDPDQRLFARASTALVLIDDTTMRPRRLTDAERLACAVYMEPKVEFSRP